MSRQNDVLSNLIGISRQTCVAVSEFSDVVMHRGPPIFPSWNLGFLNVRKVKNLADVRKRCEKFFGESEYRLTYVSDDSCSHVSDALLKSGFSLTKQLLVLGSRIDDIEIVETEAAPRCVVDEHAIAEWTDVFMKTFFGRSGGKEACAIFKKATEVRRYVAFVDNLPAAIISYFGNAGVGQIGSVATLTPYRGKGLATCLFEKCLSTAALSGDEFVYLTVSPDNSFAKFYHNRGFSFIGKQLYFSPVLGNVAVHG